MGCAVRVAVTTTGSSMGVPVSGGVVCACAVVTASVASVVTSKARVIARRNVVLCRIVLLQYRSCSSSFVSALRHASPHGDPARGNRERYRARCGRGRTTATLTSCATPPAPCLADPSRVQERKGAMCRSVSGLSLAGRFAFPSRVGDSGVVKRSLNRLTVAGAAAAFAWIGIHAAPHSRFTRREEDRGGHLRTELYRYRLRRRSVEEKPG